MNRFKASELISEYYNFEPPSFDDVLLVPTYSSLSSRLEPDIGTKLSSNFSLKVPVISSPMDTVTESAMAIALGSSGAMGIVHRFMTPEQQIVELAKMSDAGVPLAFAIGVGQSEKERFMAVYDRFGDRIDWVSIDVANGHSKYMLDMLKWVQSVSSYKDFNIMVGNVATGEGYKFLAENGADSVRVGIGGGSICKTRVMTGFGVPTFTSIIDCSKARQQHDLSASIIADGGVRYPSDLVKSLAAGADAVMAGRIFAGTLESPGDMVMINGAQHKVYRGMASREVQEDKRGGLRPGTCAEGVSTHIPFNGKARYILEEFSGGLRSGMTYCNSKTILDLRQNARFIRMSMASLEESHAFGTRV